MKVCVTGATSFLGTALCELLRQSKAIDVFPLSRSGRPSFDMSKILESEGLGVVGEFLQKVRPDALVHLAWGHTGRGQLDDDYHLDSNLLASKKLVDFVKTALPTCRFIGVGSQAELGPTSSIIDESTEGIPVLAYGKAKKQLGQYLLKELPNRSAWVKILTLYGPGDHERKFIPYLLRTAASGAPIEMSPGEQSWDFLHIEDAARGLKALLESAHCVGNYILCSGEAVSMKSVAILLCEKFRKRGVEVMDPHFGARPYLPGESMLLAGDPSRLQCEATWSPRIGLSEGLDDLVSKYLEKLSS